jgi:hypothetical protein
MEAYGALRIRFTRAIVTIKTGIACCTPALYEFHQGQSFWVSRIDYGQATADHDGDRLARSCALHFTGADANLGTIEDIAEDAFEVVEATRTIG